MKFDVLGAIEPGGSYVELMAAKRADVCCQLQLLAALDEREKGRIGR